MSTRCQVKVTNGVESLTLYHHTDGYPENMLPLIAKAWKKYGQGWEGARVGKVASMLCAVDPVVFEPLDYHYLHCDIDHYYVVNCTGESHVGANPVWTITHYEVNYDLTKKLKDIERIREVEILKVNAIKES